MEMSYPKFLEWASAGTEQWRESFPGTSRSNQTTFTYDHLVCYMWQHYARCLVVISENPAVASASKEELPAVRDFVLVSRILATDAKRRMGYFAECASTNEVLKVAEEQLEAATGVAVNAEVLHEHIAAICTHVQPSPLVAYGLLLGPAPREVVGKSLLPKVHRWMHILLGLPSVADDGAPDIEGLIKEHLALRLYLQRRKRGRQDLQLEGGVVTLSKRSRKVGEREQTKRDRQNLLSAIHAVRTKVAFKNVAMLPTPSTALSRSWSTWTLSSMVPTSLQILGIGQRSPTPA